MASRASIEGMRKPIRIDRATPSLSLNFRPHVGY